MAIRVGYVIFSLEAYSRINQNSLLGFVIESPLHEIAPIKIPGPFSFIVSLSLIGLSAKETCAFEFNIKDENEHIFKSGVSRIKGDLSLINTPIPKEFHTLFLSFKVNNINFNTEGVHTYEVIVDGEPIKTDSFFVYQLPQLSSNGGNSANE